MNDYLSNLKSLSDAAIRVQVMMMKRQIYLLGTDVIIETYDRTTDYSSAFGSAFQTDNFIKSKSKLRTERVIINRNRFSGHFTKQAEPLTIYHYNPILSTGDLVVFTQDNIKYKFKTIHKFSYGLSPYMLYRWELEGLPESTIRSSGGFIDLDPSPRKKPPSGDDANGGTTDNGTGIPGSCDT